MAFGFSSTRLASRAALVALVALGLLAQGAQATASKHDAFIDEFGPLFSSATAGLRAVGVKMSRRSLQTGQTISVQMTNGVATNEDYPPCTDNVTRICNEAANSIGPGVCGRDSECFNGRVCNATGFCVGSVSYNVVVTTVTTQKSALPVEPPKMENEVSAADKIAALRQQLDGFVDSVANGNVDSAKFDSVPVYYNETVASAYLKDLNSSISAEVAAFQKANPLPTPSANATLPPKPTAPIVQNTVVNVTANSNLTQTSSFNVSAKPLSFDIDLTRPSSLFMDPYSTDDFDAQPGETNGYIQVLKAMQVKGSNLTAAVSKKAVQSSVVKEVGAESDQIDSLPKFFAALPQSPNFEKSALFSAQNSLKNVTAFVDSQGIYSGGVNASAVASLNSNSQSQVLYNPEVTLAGYHPPEESQAYLQVLNSMHVEPTVVSAAGHNGLNKALLKLLNQGDQFLGAAQNSVGSNGVLVNDLVQNVAKLAFTSSAAPLRKEINELQSLAQRRLQAFMNAYLDHVAHKSGSGRLNGERLDRAASFERRLNCIVDSNCDFRELAEGRKSLWGSVKSFFHRAPAAAPTAYSDSDPLIQFFQEAAKQLPGLNPDSQIKSNALSFIDRAHEALAKEGARFPELNAKFQERLANLKANLPTYQSLTQEQFKTLLAGWNEDVKAQIDAEFTKERLGQRAVYLASLKAKIDDLESLLGSSTPKDTVLVADLELLKSNIQAQIDAFRGAQSATEDEMAAARAYLKDDFLQNLRGVDVPKSTLLVQSVANKTAALLRSDFGKSLNFENLNFIVGKSVAAAHSDFDRMKSVSKASGFMLNNTDLDTLARNVQDEFQKGRTARTSSFIDLSDFKAEVEKLNKELAWRPSSSDKAHNAADVLVMYENAVFNYLGSDQFYSSIRDYVGKYYDVYRGHAALLTPFFQLSNVYKTLTAGLDNPNALGTASPAVARALRVSTAKVIENQHLLSAFDRKVFSIFHHLLAELADGGRLETLARKLENVLGTLSGLSADSKHFCFCELRRPETAVLASHDLGDRALRNLKAANAAARDLESVARESSERGSRLQRRLKEVDFRFAEAVPGGLIDRLLRRRELRAEKGVMRESQFWGETAAHLDSAAAESRLMASALGEAERELAAALASL